MLLNVVMLLLPYYPFSILFEPFILITASALRFILLDAGDLTSGISKLN